MSTPSLAFSQLPLTPLLQANLASLGFTTMTPIQALTLPAILTGQDIIAKAKTGSGKTAAFGLGLLSAIVVENYALQALVICPTRELAEQVTNELRRLARLLSNVKIITLCGGTPVAKQINSLAQPAHIVVATPGRLLDHLQKNTLNLDALRLLVLDEADRMLDMGFAADIMTIIAHTPPSRQTLLFSATYPEGIATISQQIQRQAQLLAVDEVNQQIAQYFYEIDESRRKPLLAKLLNAHPRQSVLVFCNTKLACQEVAGYLDQLGFSVIALHGDLEQREREQVLVQFTNKTRSILVATDVAARGLDIKELDRVINYQIAYDPKVHVHRVGRTGRAGENGQAITLVAAEEMPQANLLAAATAIKLHWLTLSNTTLDAAQIVKPSRQTLLITLGRKDKLRPGDILGALTKDAGLAAAAIGKIILTDRFAYIAIEQQAMAKALDYFKHGKVKGKSVRAHCL